MLMLSPFANADMDYVCGVNSPIDVDDTDFIFDQMEDYIEEVGCERNNILMLTLPMLNPFKSNEDYLDRAVRNESLMFASALWCRHDRNEKIEGNQLRCVLYDTKPRKTLFNEEKYEKTKYLNEDNFDMYAVRVKVFENQEDAKALKRIINNYFPAYIDVLENNNALTAVYVGPFRTREDIDKNIEFIYEISETVSGEVVLWKP